MEHYIVDTCGASLVDCHIHGFSVAFTSKDIISEAKKHM